MDKAFASYVESCIQHHSVIEAETLEFQYREKLEQRVEECLSTWLSKDDKEIVDELLAEKAALHQTDHQRLYRQAMKDCVALLKELGVL